MGSLEVNPLAVKLLDNQLYITWIIVRFIFYAPQLLDLSGIKGAIIWIPARNERGKRYEELVHLLRRSKTNKVYDKNNFYIQLNDLALRGCSMINYYFYKTTPRNCTACFQLRLVLFASWKCNFLCFCKLELLHNRLSFQMFTNDNINNINFN